MSFLKIVTDVVAETISGKPEAEPQMLGSVANRDTIIVNDVPEELSWGIEQGYFSAPETLVKNMSEPLATSQTIEQVVSAETPLMEDNQIPNSLRPVQHAGELVMFDAARDRRMAEARELANAAREVENTVNKVA